VNDQPCSRLPSLDGVSQSFDDQRLGHVVHQSPADDATRGQIHHQSQVTEDTSLKWNLRNVSHPDLIDSIWCICIGQKVRSIPQSMPTVGCLRHERFPLNGSKTLCFHDSRSSPWTAHVPPILEFAGNPSSTVTTSMFRKDVSYLRSQFLIVLLKRRRIGTSPGIERGSIHVEDLASFHH
jgi:hypothetical protein